MDPFGNDEIPRLLRLKRYEQPPPGYFENFLHEFRRRQRDELLRQPSWRIWFERVQGFAVQCNVRPLAAYSAAVVAVLVCGAVVSIRIYQQPEPAQVTHQSSLIPNPLANAERELNLASPAVRRTFNAERILRLRSRDIPFQPTELLRSDEFVPLKLKRESLDDQPLPEK